MLTGCSLQNPIKCVALPHAIIITWGGGLNGAAMTSQMCPDSPSMQTVPVPPQLTADEAMQQQLDCERTTEPI